MYVLGDAGNDVNEYNLTTAFDVSTASYVRRFAVGTQETYPHGMSFNNDGTKIFITGYSGDDVNEYSLSTAFDVSTASYVQRFVVSSQESVPQGITFNNDGTKMFIVGSTGDDVNEYSLSTAFDVSTASYVQLFSVNSEADRPRDIAFNNDGTKMFIVDQNGAKGVNEYNLTTAFDISTSSYVQNFSVSAQESAPQALAFSNDGTKMFISGSSYPNVYAYNLSTAFDVSSASYVGNPQGQFWVQLQDISPTGITFNNDGTKMFMTGTNKDNLSLIHI